MSSNYFPSTGGKPKFNPNASYEAAQEPAIPKGKKPAFNPRGSYEPIHEPIIQQSAQPAFQVQISQPAFGSQQMSGLSMAGTVVSDSGIRGPKEFSFDKPYDPLAVEKLKGKAVEAQGKLHAELKGNDKIHEKQVREFRRDSYTIEDLREDYARQGLILSPQDEQQFLKKEKQRRYDAPVSAEDISDSKSGTILDQQSSRRFIKNLNNPEVAKNAYLVDKYNEIANDPNGNHRVDKIKKVADLIGKKVIIYDTEKKVAIKPLGMIGSAIEGVKNKFKAQEEYEFFKNAPDAAIINQLEADRNNPDTDEPISVPKGKAQEILMSLTEMPISPIIAGAAGTFGGTLIGNPELGVIAGSALGAYENRKSQYQSTFRQVYNELRDQGLSEAESIEKARSQAKHAQEIGTVVGAAQGVIGAGISATPLRFSAPYQRSIGQLLKQSGSDLGKIALEGMAQGGIASIGEVAKNKIAQSIGIKRDISSGVADAFWDNMALTVGIGAAMKAGRGMAKVDYRNILHGLSKVPDDIINTALQEKVNNGEVTQQAADETIQRINEYKGLDKLIPDNVSEEARFKIQDKILKRRELESQIETTDKAYHPAIKEKIKNIDEEILNLSKGTVKPEKAESGLSKVKEKEAIETAEEFLAEGVLPPLYENMIKADPVGFWKMIAQQAQNRDENWNKLTQELPEQAVRDQFGDTVVEYAKELFPAPDVALSTENVAIIRPEVITIKPEENAIQERSTTSINVDETPEHSQEMVGGIPESGEATIPQEGQPIQEESITPGQEGQVEEPQMIGITHRQMDAVAKELGLETYTKDASESLALWDKQAREMLAKDPDTINRIVNKLRNGEQPDKVETRALIMNLADKKAKYNANPTAEALNEIKRLKDLYNISGREEARAFYARRGSVPVEESLADFHLRDTEYNRAPLTKEQEAQSTKEYNEIKKAKEEYEQRVAKLEAENAKLKAEKVVKDEAKKANKSTGKNYVEERKQILTDLKKKWDSSKGQLSSTFIPYADRLVKIAPDVIKLMKSYVEQGITELPDVVKSIHRTIKDHLDGITEKDIHDIIAGEYNEKKQTRNQLAQQLFDLRKEAKLINELEQLEAGKVPDKPEKIRQHNRKIEAANKGVER
jgi:hypothetical protein